MATKKKTRRLRSWRIHTFLLHVDHHDGRGEQEVPINCKVILAKKGVSLVLKTQDVLLSNKLGGVGNSALCAMAQCTKRLVLEFPHPHLGVVDWLKKTCFVLTKMPEGKKPGACVKYEHNDLIAHEFDEPGQQALLDRLARHDGQIVVHLVKPRDRRGETTTGGTGKYTGARSTPSGLGAIAKRRFATAMAQRLKIEPSPTGYRIPEGRPRSSPRDDVTRE